MEPDFIGGTKNIREYVDPQLVPQAIELGWTTYGLWVQHDPIREHSVFDDINYQRTGEEGKIQLECVENDVMARTVKTKEEKMETCL